MIQPQRDKSGGNAKEKQSRERMSELVAGGKLQKIGEVGREAANDESRNRQAATREWHGGNRVRKGEWH